MIRAALIAALAILLIGCSTTGSHTNVPEGNLTPEHAKMVAMEEKEDDPGVCVPISASSSVNIDFLGIWDYVQGESTLSPEAGSSSEPWIRFNLTY